MKVQALQAFESLTFRHFLKGNNNMKSSKKHKKSTKLANPVTSLANKIATVFEGDESITTKFYFNKSTLRVICEKPRVAAELAAICKDHFDLGNLHLDIQFLYIDHLGKKVQIECGAKHTNPEDFAAAFTTAFKDRYSYGGVSTAVDPFQSTWYYLQGSAWVCQYDNDDTRNPWGVTSCLPEDVFAELLAIPNGVKVSTIYTGPIACF